MVAVLFFVCVMLSGFADILAYHALLHGTVRLTAVTQFHACCVLDKLAPHDQFV